MVFETERPTDSGLVSNAGRLMTELNSVARFWNCASVSGRVEDFVELAFSGALHALRRPTRTKTAMNRIFQP